MVEDNKQQFLGNKCNPTRVIQNLKSKMVGENSPEFASGKILYGLKMSKLNYVVKETPYSAYITIRKTFIKDDTAVGNTNSDDFHTLNSDKDIELNNLKGRTKDLETLLELAKVNFEEIELGKELMVKKLSAQDDEIESFLQTEKELKEQIKVLAKDNEDMRSNIDQDEKDIEELELMKEHLESDKSDLNDKIEELCREIFDLKQSGLGNGNLDNTKAIEQKLFKTQDKLMEASENILILEATLENKEFENNSLRNKLISETERSNTCENSDARTKTKTESEVHISHNTDDSVPSTSKCGECDYESDDEIDMKFHAKSKHNGDFKCTVCDIDLKSGSRLKTHMCRVPILNPSYGSLYLRSWYDANGCTPIYCSKNNSEIAWLHHSDCTDDTNPCAASADIEAEDDDKIEGLEHLKME